MARFEKDRVLLAYISGVADRHATLAARSGHNRAGAITELAELAAGRSDLLAECAGIAIGFHEGDLDEAHYLAAAQLCLEAGADQSAIARWIAEGRHRAEKARARTPGTRTAE